MDRPLCQKCKKNLARRRGNGFRKNCDKCDRSPEKMKERNRVKTLRSRGNKRPWVEFKKDYCESPNCKWDGPYAPFQLDVDHIDGDRNNNDPSNYMTLCAMCHRMKTYENQEWSRPGARGKNAWVPVDSMEALVLDCSQETR